MNNYFKNFRGQVTIFIIIAVVLVASVAIFFMVRGGVFKTNIPSSIEPVYASFLSCLEDNVYTGIDVMESQAGYIELPDFEPGSNYMPFSSQLDFLGNPIPYWYYVSGNNVEKQQVPSKSEMENQLANFVEERINNCRFDSYYGQGFEIDKGEPSARIFISDTDVRLDLTMDLNVQKEEDKILVRNHQVNIKSNLGGLYNSAKKIYNKEQEDLFLEKYAVDNLRLYAPVDGVELTCSPKIWNANDILEEVQDAVESNTLALKGEGDVDDYFNTKLGVDEDVRFINSKNWAYSFEINPTDGNILIANPVGNQPGLGILGFCYVPYHFVYDLKYPVLIQVSNPETQETFQFPVAVVIQGNVPRESLDASASESQNSGLCEYKNAEVNVNVYDTNLNRVDAEISYECFGTKCNIGETEGGFLKEMFPRCVNGYVLARAEGFEDAKYLYTTTSSGSLDVIMDRVYERDIELRIDGMVSNKNAIITFTSDRGSRTVAYPEQKSVGLSEGQYEIQVQVYSNSSFNLGATTTQQCVDVPQPGLGGLFGFTKEQCFDIEMPSQLISNALTGGGKQDYYILESSLRNSNTIEINAESLQIPTNLDQLQNNHILFEDKKLGVYFR
ncbi:MAG: hypothetical protein Q8P15_03835 [Nanoarchaeota archaeon]|nr:hypothetical protein [Nanoarchaeota archaeon]